MSGLKSVLVLGLGFVVAFSCCLPFVDWESDESRSDEKPQKDLAKSRVIQERSKQGFIGDLKGWISGRKESGREELLALAARAGKLSSENRKLALEMLLELPEEERRSMLAVLLVRWLEEDPEGAVTWCESELKGAERRELLFELTTTWAHQDAQELAYWWAENIPDADLYKLGRQSVGKILSQVNPLVFAEYLELPRLHQMVSMGDIPEEALPGPEGLPNYAKSFIGKVAYKSSDPELLRQRSTARHQKGKSGWNQLFEMVAVKWHRDSPEKCEAWLSQFPEEAQISARHRIKDDQR